MKSARTRTWAGYLSACLLVVLAGGCTSAAVRTTYGLQLDGPGRVSSNGGDRYSIVQIRENGMESVEGPDSRTLARSVQSRLVRLYPEWFSDGVDAVPVIVVSRSSPPRAIYGVGACLSSTALGLGALFTLGAVPSRSLVHRMDFETRLLGAGNRETRACDYSAETLHVSALPSMLDAFWPESAGWKRIDERAYPAGFERDDPRREEALCTSIVRLVQELGAEEREAVRNNGEAWYWDAKLGNKRNRRVEIMRTAQADGDRGGQPVLPGAEPHPAILEQTWDCQTRRGTLRCDFTGCSDRNAALKWIRDEYLPEYSALLGVAVSADRTEALPPADVRIDRFEVLENGIMQIEFRILD